MLQAYLRSGCVQLTFDTLQLQPPDITWARVAEALGPDVLANRAVLVQYRDQADLLVDGKLQASWAPESEVGPAQLTAQLHSVTPSCIVAGQAAELLVTGADLDQPGVKLYARCQGRYLPLSVAPAPAPAPAPAGPAGGGSSWAGQAGGLSSVLVQLPALDSPCLVWLECEQQRLISRSLPLVAMPDAASAAELLQLEQAAGREQMSKVRLPYC